MAGVIDPSTLDGTNGFRLDGANAYDGAGRSVSGAGDVNGDGFADVIIGAPFVNVGGGYAEGEAYLVFGKAGGFAPGLDLAALDGSNGFRLPGIDPGDQAGWSVSGAGDVNGDGFDDLLIGAPTASVPLSPFTGEAYVVFGKADGFGATLDLASLNGANGFRLAGIPHVGGGGAAGSSVSGAGDVNGDGFADVIVGAFEADYDAGESYVVFGKAGGFDASLDLATLNGTNGFRIDGINAGDRSGSSVSDAGDVNGDGLDDLVIGAPFAGQSYVVFGKGGGFGASLDLATLDGTNGFRLDGIDASTWAGFSVSGAGDVNGDGFDDLVIGAPYADETYVVFGRAGGFGASLDLATLNGTNGFRIEAGPLVSSAGDVNRDGFDDVIIGTFGAGETYVIYGKASGFAARLDPATLDGTNGVVIEDATGPVSGAGDVNRDGFDDFVIGVPDANTSYVLFGSATLGGTEVITRTGTEGDDTLLGTNLRDSIDGLGGNDVIRADDRDDTVAGGAGRDTLNGGQGDDRLAGGAGQDWVSYARDPGGVTVDLRTGAATDGWGDTDTLSGIEHVIGSGGGDVISGSFEANRLAGLTRNDRLNGRGGDDRLEGGGESDTLIGGPGDDLLDGGRGADRLSGGSGADRFQYRAPLNSPATGGHDILLDFSRAEGDRLDLHRMDADATRAGDQAFAFVGRGAFTAAGQLRFVRDAANERTFVEANVDAGLAADFRIELAGLHSLAAGDFGL